MKNQQIVALKNYKQLLKKILSCVNKTQGNIANIVTRQKVIMSWEIGKIIGENLEKNPQKNYSDQLFTKLESDTKINKTVLYKMHGFYKSYPKLPKDDSQLNWSHYRVLSGVKEASERKRLENFVRENSWDSDRLQREVQKTKIAQIHEEAAVKQEISKPKKLTPRRGKLFSYSLLKFDGDEKFYIDCGFEIFRQVEEGLPAGDVQAVESFKKGKNYSLKKSTTPLKQRHIYKARLDRVVDGDTLYVILDLGFKTAHREKLRLRAIDAPELSTKEGQKSLVALKKILKDLPFLVVKTTAVDVYGRYVCDVFLPEENQTSDPQKVADSGIFLNQILLDKGLAVAV